MKKTLILTTAILSLFVSCKTSQPKSDSFDANLSAYRSEIINPLESTSKDENLITEENTEAVVSSSAIPEGEMHEQIESMIGQMAQRDYSKVEGYRIMLYSTTSRSMANSAYRKAKALYHEPVYYKYDQPNYKIIVGDYFSKRLAHEKLKMLQEEFSKAIIFNDFIKVTENSVLNLTPDEPKLTAEEYQQMLSEIVEEEDLPEIIPDSDLPDSE